MDAELEEWLGQALYEYDRKKCISKVLSTDRTDAVQKGANYASDMYRLKTKVLTKAGDIEERQLLYKALPLSEHRRNGLKMSGFFSMETRMYLETLPEMERILKEKEPGAEPLWPICYGVKRGNEGYLLQDLCTLGYKMEDRMIGMDFKHASLAIQSLAKFHALAAIGIERGDIASADYNVYGLARSKERISIVVGTSFIELAETIKTWSSEWSDYSESVRQFGQKYPDLLLESLKRDDTKFNTLNHGDCWLNNMMFSYTSAGDLKSVRFIDYQMPHINGPGFDLQYFLTTSLSYKIFCRKQELLQIYHDSLVKNLVLFGFAAAPPSLDDVTESYKKAAVFGLGFGLTLRPLMMVPSQDAPDMEEIAKAYSSGVQRSISKYNYDGEVFLRTLRDMLMEGRAAGFL